MTVCVALKVQDCIVFSADSATSLSRTHEDGREEVINVYKNGVKVFNLHKGLPIVSMTCGAGNVGTQSISFLAKELRINLSKEGSGYRIDPADYTIRSVADAAFAFFKKQFDGIGLPASNEVYFEFWLGGYGSKDSVGEIWKISYHDSKLHEPVCESAANQLPYIGLGGQNQVIHRILAGFDPGLADVLNKLGLESEQVDNVIRELRSNFTTPLVDRSMPVIDAIQLAQFLVDTTKGYFKYLPYADIVGGETEIATVTKHEGFKWINRKHYYLRELNQGDTDHAC